MKKVLSWLLTMAIMVSMVSFAIAEGDAAVSVLDFEDGNFAFLGLSMAKGNADKATLSVVDFNGSKALKVEGTGKVPYVAFNVDGLLGENITKLASVTFDVGVDAGSDGKFYVVSGKTYAYAGAELNESSDDWSVYLARSNPKGAKAVLDESFIAGAGNHIVISKETDNAQTKLGTPVAFYIDNIRFLDADGKELALDTSAVYADATVEADLSNLLYLTDAVEFANTASAGGWSQATLESGEDIIAALEPGKVVEISFESASGNMWLVFPDSAAGWTRVGNDDVAYINDSKNLAQVTYEMIAEKLGEDKSTWGSRVQCEASDAWQVYAIRVGTANPVVSLGDDAVEFGDTASAGAWSQGTLESGEAIIAALEPGKAIAISFESEDNTMWTVFPDSAAGWTRVGNDGKATIQGGVAYIPYEMIVEALGEDKSAWGSRVQAESASAWTSYSVSVGTLMASDPRQPK